MRNPSPSAEHHLALALAACAILAVLLAHALGAALIGHTQGFDVVMHFLGGSAVAFSIHRIVGTKRAQEFLGDLTTFGMALLSFSFTCAVAVGWEFAEFITDQIRHTHIDLAPPPWTSC